MEKFKVVLQQQQSAYMLCATKIVWNTKHEHRPAALEVEMVAQGKILPKVGDSIHAYASDDMFFSGFVFKVSQSQNKQINVLCYDQIRYLIAKDSYIFENKTASEILELIAKDFGLKIGEIQNTKTPLDFVYQDKTLLFMIENAISLSTGRFSVFDEKGFVCLKNIDENFCPKTLGDFSLVQNYNVSNEIDSQTHNKIKLSKKNKKTGKYEVFIAKDLANIQKWGALQFFDKAQETLSNAQTQARAQELLEKFNRERKTIVLQGIGDVCFRAGFKANVIIEEAFVGNAIITDAVHEVFQDTHTMRLELEI